MMLDRAPIRLVHRALCQVVRLEMRSLDRAFPTCVGMNHALTRSTVLPGHLRALPDCGHDVLLQVLIAQVLDRLGLPLDVGVAPEH